MTREQRDSLRRLAEAATPGPWAYSPRRGTIGVRSNDHDQSFGMMADTSQPAYPMWLVSMKETCSPDTSQWRPKEAKRS